MEAITVGSYSSEHVGTKECSDKQITDHRRKLYYRFLMSGHGQEIILFCMCYYWIFGV